MVDSFSCGHVRGEKNNGLVARKAGGLAISNFLRQHDLVQVQWVFLSSGFPEHPSETPET
jgi:hypothetical protein